jgi:predicted TPR repeat methyltransferase
VFKKVASLVCKNGVFIFTISENKINENDYFLMPSSRFVHSQKYVENMIKKYAYIVIKNERKILRKEGDKDIVGQVYLIKKI